MTQPTAAASNTATGATSVETQPAQALTFVEFYHTHYDPIARALSSTLGDAALGRESADEAMTRAYGSWATVAGYGNPQGWVYRVGYNWAVSRRRRMARRLPWAPAQVDLPPMPDITLQAAVDRLDSRFRSVVVCRYLLDWSTDQTADALGIPANTVKSRLASALRQLREDLSPEI